MNSLKYTNYLGELLNGRPINLELVGQWEAVITFCAYISRLNYDLKPNKILEAFKFLHFSPIIFNTVLGLLTRIKLDDHLPLQGSLDEKEPIAGYFIYDKPNDLPLSITLFDYSKGESRMFPNEKIIVVGFRGTLSFRTVFKDMNMKTKELSTVFKDLPSVASGQGKAHSGFINGMASVFTDIVQIVDRIMLDNQGISRIIITGHSLGAAYAHLCGMGFANLKRTGKAYPKINIISFGAPKAFSESGRDIFNSLLIDGYMTLDRIVNSPYSPDPLILTTNIIPAIPHFLYHPGFTLLTVEKYRLKKSLRSRHVANTRRIAGLERKQGMLSLSRISGRNYNPLPYYNEFFNKFKDSYVNNSFTQRHYKELINYSLNGTVYTGITDAAKQAREIVRRILHLTPQELSIAGRDAALGEKEAGVLESAAARVELNIPAIDDAIQQEKQEEQKEEDKLPKEGGDPQSYKDVTLTYYPNELVYTCSGITTPAPPPVQCHLGYMGVGWLGVGSAIVPLRGRGYDRYAIVYNIEGRMVFVSDRGLYFPLVHILNNKISSIKSRKTRKNRK